MFTYPEINPVALALGPIKIHWYGLTYLFGFVCGWYLARLRARKPNSGWDPDEVGDLVFYVALGVILGGRLGSILFYNFGAFLEDPFGMLVSRGGMSFHGGFLGVLVAFWLYARKTNRSLFQVADFLAPFFPIGLGAGRIGNFINGELWGRVTDVPWGMVFPHVDSQVRHPNQLYQFFFEGVVLFIILWVYSRKPRPTMAVSGLFGVAYGCYRFMIEFVREPDSHLGFIALDWLTMGQLLSIPMIIIGGLMMIWAYRNGLDPSTAVARSGVQPETPAAKSGRSKKSASQVGSPSGQGASQKRSKRNKRKK